MFLSRRRLAASPPALNFWPAMADMILAALFVALLLFFGVSVVDLLTRGRLALQVNYLEVREAELKRVEKQLADTISRLNQLLVSHSHLEREFKSNDEARRQAEIRLASLLAELKHTKNSEGLITILQRRIGELETLLTTLDAKVTGLKKSNVDLTKLLNDKPPIIKIAEGGKDGKEVYRFKSGDAEVNKAFREGLREGGFKELAGEIISRNGPGGRLGVDTLEIIGHTDGAPLSKLGNLDTQLPSFLGGNRQSFGKLVAGSNNDLGLLRALAIKEAWLDYTADHPQKDILEQVELRCYSAGQTLPGEDIALRDGRDSIFSEKNVKLRRIEIRLTKLR
jgi:hypothetical protein